MVDKIQLISCILLDNTTYKLYNSTMKNKLILNCQGKILETVPLWPGGYYLGGGTALARMYFHHRDSLDLDFFTRRFIRKEILGLASQVKERIKKDIQLICEQTRKDYLMMLVFSIDLGKGMALKIDFIEDWLGLINPVRLMDGVPVLSLEDIYIRKIYTVSGTVESKDIVGKKIFLGGREEAKDFYDLYFLSHTFQRLSDFVKRYGNPTIKEALINWYRTYNRMDIKTGILELASRKEIDYHIMERHFKGEIDAIIKEEIR